MAVKQSRALNPVKKVGFKSKRVTGQRASATTRDSTITTWPDYGSKVLDNAFEDIP